MMNVAKQALASDPIASIHISNLSESHPIVVPATIDDAPARDKAREACDELRPSDDANATIQ